MAPRICILLHEADPYPQPRAGFIWGLRDAWLEHGFAVDVVKGLARLRDADVVVPHLDATYTPDSWRRALDCLPTALNRGLYDISKRKISANLVEPGTNYRGPVVVKTNLNCGGRPERVLARLTRPRLLRWSTRVGERCIHRRTRGVLRQVAEHGKYILFEQADLVPQAAFRDPRLVVERFLPEREGDMYFARWYLFIGDRYRSMRVGARHPLVKLSRVESTEYSLPVPREVVALRERLQMDFGKIDYVVHNGQVVILDVNRTPGDRGIEQRLALCRPYALGILPLAQRGSRPYAPLPYQDVDPPGVRNESALFDASTAAVGELGEQTLREARQRDFAAEQGQGLE